METQTTISSMVCYTTTFEKFPKEDLQNCPLWQATVTKFFWQVLIISGLHSK
jgi:hypothetical protein